MLRICLLILLMTPMLRSLNSLGDTERRKLLRGLGLEEPQPVFMRIPINLMFTGFHRESLGKFQLTHNSLRTWFEHVEDHVPYRTVDAMSKRVLRTSDSVFYDFQIRVIEVDKLVDAALEAALKTFMRRERMRNTTHYQVDADRMASVLESLLHALGLSDSYTFIVANPDVSFLGSGKPYGYRTGFSSEEISFLYQQHKDRKLSLSLSDKEKENVPDDHNPDHEAEPITKQERKPAASVEFVDRRGISEKWASSFLIQNQELIKQREASLKISDEQCDKPETIVLKDELDRTLLKSGSKHEAEHGHARGHRINMELMKNASVLSRHIVRSGSEDDRKYLQQVVELGPEVIHANCLVDVWIGRGRYAWLDLSAGPFTWGPKQAMKTDRVRSIHSFPRVSAQQDDKVDSEDTGHTETLSKLQKMIGMPETKEELEILLVSWERYCRYYNIKTKKQKRQGAGGDAHFEPFVCQYLARRFEALGGSDTDEEGFDIQRLAIGGVDPDITKIVDVDGFLSHLGYVLSSGLGHIITPPSLAVRKSDRFPDEVKRIMVYVLYNHKIYDPLATNMGGLDSDLLKHEINKFRTTDSEIEVAVWPLSLSSHPLLAYAFSYAQKAATFRQQDTQSTVNYLDSSLLEDELHNWLEADATRSSSKAASVSVIVFSVARDQPLLIDKFYQAVPLSNMVLAVQNAQTKWHSPITCNGEAMTVNLRNPTKWLLSALVTHLFGVGWLHVFHGEDSSKTASDWLWSVGDSPFSDTSTAGHFSSLQQDAVHRNAIASAIQEASDRLNAGIAVLASLPDASVLSKDFVWRYVSLLYPKIRKQIYNAASKASRLGWYSALQSARNATKMADTFLVACQDVADRARRTSCENEEGFFASAQRLAMSQWLVLVVWSVPVSLTFSFLLWWIGMCLKQKTSRGFSSLPRHNKRL